MGGKQQQIIRIHIHLNGARMTYSTCIRAFWKRRGARHMVSMTRVASQMAPNRTYSALPREYKLLFFTLYSALIDGLERHLGFGSQLHRSVMNT